MNKAHWSVTLTNASQPYLQTINHKFKTWKNLMDPQGQFHFSKDIQLSEKLPEDLFNASSHNIGTIMLTDSTHKESDLDHVNVNV